MRVIVHGGAGGAPEDPPARQEVLEAAARTGADAADPLDAVEAAINRLEASPRFNAGVGGAIQADGVVRTDAGVMTGGREAGAACSMPGVERAVSVARAVCEETPHVLLAGDPAVAFAEAVGVETGVDLRTERTRERWAEVDPPEDPADRLAWVRDRFGRGGDAADHDTVGAVAVGAGRIAAATSTGGRWLALAGRVGDVPQLGSGFYAGPAGGASATGAGEDIAKATLSRRAVRHLERGVGPERAAETAIEEFAELTGSRAGVIVADRDGGTGSAFNSDAMQTATRDG